MTDLMDYQHPDESDDDALTGPQFYALKKGVRAAVDAGPGHALAGPGDLNPEHWEHRGVGVSVWMHRSGVVVLTSGEDNAAIVTDVSTLDRMDAAKAGFFGEFGQAHIENREAAKAQARGS